MGVVVDPGQQAQDEEQGDDEEELGQGLEGRLENLPALKAFHHKTGQKAELGTSRSRLINVKNQTDAIFNTVASTS